ncbi:hypothetical protein [Amycolatopsis echigonensis]
MSSLPPHLDQVMRDHLTVGTMEITESMLAMQDAINQTREGALLARDIMAPVRPGTARRLALRRPCPCAVE